MQLHRKKKNPILKWERTATDIFPKKTYKWPTDIYKKSFEKFLNITKSLEICK